MVPPMMMMPPPAPVKKKNKKEKKAHSDSSEDCASKNHSVSVSHKIHVGMFVALQDTQSEPGDGGAGAPGILAAFFHWFRDPLD